MRYLLFSCICLCCLNLMSCYQLTVRDKLFSLRANTHYWEGVLGKDSIKIKDIRASYSLMASGVMVIGDSSYSFSVYKFDDIFFDKIRTGPSLSGSHSYFFDTCFIHVYHAAQFRPLLDDEAKAYLDSLTKNDTPFHLKLTQKPYNPNYSPSRYEQKLLKKIGYPQQSN